MLKHISYELNEKIIKDYSAPDRIYRENFYNYRTSDEPGYIYIYGDRQCLESIGLAETYKTAEKKSLLQRFLRLFKR